jgi:integrase/recombinase XerD
MKFSQLIEGFFLDKTLVLSSNTVTTYKYYFASFVEFAGDLAVEAITATTVKKYLIWLVNERGLSKRSAHDRYTVLCSLYSWANEELGTENIMSKVTKPKYEKRVIEPFTPDEMRTLLNNLPKDNHRFSAIFLTLLDSGLRISELINLTIGDYTQDSGKVFVRGGKGNKDRFLFLGKKSRKAIWRYLAERGDVQASEPLFVTATGTRLNRNNVRRDLGKYGEQFGIHCHPHKCRHTFAVNFLRNQGNVRQLQMILGHSRLDMIQTYTKLAEIDLQQAAQYSPVDNL